MYYTADSPVIVSEESSMISDNNNKGFDNSYQQELFDLESEASYEELFSGNMSDQAVPDFMTLNTPAVTSCNNYPVLSQPTYMNGLIDDISSSESSYMSMHPPSYYSHVDYSSPAVPTHVPVPTSLSESRGPVIMTSTTPEQKPRRKGGRKPKNDPLPPHLEERRRLRRIRNKEAAQKCRERRLAHTNVLLAEIEQLERQTREYELFINRLRETKEQCEFILNSHRNTCMRNNQRTVLSTAAYNPYVTSDSCSAAHRRSSSNSDNELQSTPCIL